MSRNSTAFNLRLLLVLLACVALVALVVSATARASQQAPAASLSVEVVSSAPDQVSGGNARLHITLPDNIQPADVTVLVNDADQSDRFTAVPDANKLSGVIDGLQIGTNTVSVQADGAESTSLLLKNHPISGPIFSGPQQQPFMCSVQRHGLGQPLVDSPDTGFPVYAVDENGDPTDEIIGYSLLCGTPTQVVFLYKSTDGEFKPYEPGQERPSDMAQTTTIDGLTVDYIVRWERGTINRFIYSIAMLAPDATGPDDLTTSAWNGKLIYYFQGGVGIGHYQGDPSVQRMLYDYGLSSGYAVAYSTGTKTGEHYNLVLGGETALMVKEHFMELYDVPVYTVGVGGSGGGIQQYVYGQNHKGLIDAAIPQYSYPDMVTQTIHVGDCELLEYFMDRTDGNNPRWKTWSNRSLIEGMNASDTIFNPYRQAPGSTECVNAWRGLSPLTINPLYGRATGQELYEPQTAVAGIEWSYFSDIRNVVGLQPDGYARRYWDNVGVQYGLSAVASGAITPEEFLNLNANIGGWKDAVDMVQEGSPFYPPGEIDFTNWDPWSARNQVLSPNSGNTPAQRNVGDLAAMRAVYDAGLVFTGDVDIPMIDWRHYLEPVLDMHNSHQSFAARQRIIDRRGSADNQVVWFTAISEDGLFDQTPEAFEVMDEWMTNLLVNPGQSVADSKPERATDRCFDAAGNEIAAGDDVWNGILNDEAPGACAELFPVYSTSRIVAGGPFKGSIFKCQLKSVEQAIVDGDYGSWVPTASQRARLNEIFADGVCNYSRPDVALTASQLNLPLVVAPAE